jgi:hypothetical protein
MAASPPGGYPEQSLVRNTHSSIRERFRDRLANRCKQRYAIRLRQRSDIALALVVGKPLLDRRLANPTKRPSVPDVKQARPPQIGAPISVALFSSRDCRRLDGFQVRHEPRLAIRSSMRPPSGPTPSGTEHAGSFDRSPIFIESMPRLRETQQVGASIAKGHGRTIGNYAW